jgi:hypothetical protein
MACCRTLGGKVANSVSVDSVLAKPFCGGFLAQYTVAYAALLRISEACLTCLTLLCVSVWLHVLHDSVNPDHQAALGPGGLAGSFSAAAASTLAVLRGSGELLTSLLALLLADPAVDWSVEREAHAARKDQDTSVSLKLFASR